MHVTAYACDMVDLCQLRVSHGPNMSESCHTHDNVPVITERPAHGVPVLGPKPTVANGQ